MSEEKKNNETETQAKPEKKERKNKKDDEIQKLKEELDRLLKLVPLYDFACNMDISAAQLSSSVM